MNLLTKYQLNVKEKNHLKVLLKVPGHDFSSSFTIVLYLVSIFMYTQWF